MTQPDAAQRRWQWLVGAIAVVLAGAIVAGLLYVRLVAGRHAPAAAPADSGQVIGSLEMAARLDFSCSLPVRDYTGAEARVAMPDGAVTLDRAASVGKPSTASYGATYRNGRWLPVPAAWISRDGRSYAYATQTTGAPGEAPTTAVFLRDIASGKDRQLWSGTGHSQVAGWGPGGLYFTMQPASPDGKGWIDSVEFWVVDPSQTAAAHRIGPNPAPPRPANEAELPLFGLGIVQVGGGAAWTIDLGKTIGAIPPGGGSVARTPAQLWRMDLRDGTLSSWFTAPPDTGLGLIGLDAQGHPLLMATKIPQKPVGPPSPGQAPYFPPPPSLLLVSGPNQTVSIADGTDPSLRPVSVGGDAHGIWISSPGSLWLYRGGGLTRVAGVPAQLFPTPTPPPVFTPPPPGVTTASLKPFPPPGFPTGPALLISGPCS